MTNSQMFSKKLLSAFGNKQIANSLGSYVKELGYDRDYIDSLDAQGYSEFVSKVVPFIQHIAYESAIGKNKGTKHESILYNGAEKLVKAFPEFWSRDQFLGALGRKGKLNGKTRLEKDAHIGMLSNEDLLKLRNAGLTDSEIEMLADKFRKEYMESIKNDVELDAIKQKTKLDAELAKEYEENPLTKVSSIFANEVTKYIREKIANGEDPYEDILGLAKATGIDVGTWVASLYGGGLLAKGAGKVLTKIPIAGKLIDKIPNTIKSVAGPVGAVGIDAIADGGIELGRQAVSDYQDGMDIDNAISVAKTSATIPGTVATISSVGAQIPGFGRVLRPILRQIRGNVMATGDKEVAAYADMFDEISDLSKRAENGDVVASEILQERLADAKKFIENHPEAPSRPVSYDEIREIANEKSLRDSYLTQPDREYFDELIDIKQGINESDIARNSGDTKLARELESEAKANEIVEDIDNGWIPNRDKNASNLAEEKLEKAKKTWAGTWSEMSESPKLVGIGKAIGANVVPTIAKTEVGKGRTESKKSKKSSKRVMVDPITEKGWESGMFTRLGNDGINPLYIEWLKEHPEFAK